MYERVRKQLKPGDVFSLKTPKGIAYLQFVDWPVGYIPCFRVLKGVYDKPLDNEHIQKLANKEHRFITSIPFTAAKKDPTWNRIGSFVLPSIFTKLQSFINDNLDLDPEFGWHIISYTSEGRKSVFVDKLTEEQKDYPEDGVSSLDLLADRIASGWQPRDWYEKKRWK